MAYPCLLPTALWCAARLTAPALPHATARPLLPPRTLGQRHGDVGHQGEDDATLGLPWPWTPPEPPPPEHNVPAPAPFLAAHGHRPGTPGHPMPPLRQAPFTSYPSSGPGEKSGDWDSTPWSRCPVRKFFKITITTNPGKNSYPGVYCTRPQNFQTNFQPGDKPEETGSQIPPKKAFTRLYGVFALCLRG